MIYRLVNNKHIVGQCSLQNEIFGKYAAFPVKRDNTVQCLSDSNYNINYQPDYSIISFPYCYLCSIGKYYETLIDVSGTPIETLRKISVQLRPNLIGFALK
jgi:hypothetical protein